jgi:tRNA threonylcarbamoyl adenosine modification protein YeaZ
LARTSSGLSNGEMAKVLVIENSTASGSLAASVGDVVGYRAQFSRSGELAIELDKAIKQIGAPDELVVGIGPGSYTGLRVAAATAIGLAAALGCTTYGCPSVLAIEADSCWIVGDARRESVFLAKVEQGRLKAEPELVPLADLKALLRQGRSVFAVGPIPGHDDLPIVVLKAEYLLRRRESFRTSLEPLYLKPPHVTTPKGR